jgi:hypothetical protein
MSGASLPASIATYTSERASALLTRQLDQQLVNVRANHPVSILDLSPHERTSIELARWARHLGRKVRLMTYEWKETKNRDRYAGLPEVLVEKGMFPGLHFSHASFDFVVGVDVLRTLDADLRHQALIEIGKVALRQVDLLENSPEAPGAPISESQFQDALIQSGCRGADLQVIGPMIQVLIAGR